ncbi:MAG: hypothetical protein KGJ13_05060 [Patescibacteria group bacterium]|nr:hypothetical protein [Patescibacteria group bacterium]
MNQSQIRLLIVLALGGVAAYYFFTRAARAKTLAAPIPLPKIAPGITATPVTQKVDLNSLRNPVPSVSF